MALENDIVEIQDSLREGAFANEASVSSGVVFRVLQALGWPIFISQVVSPEFSVEGQRVDFALCHPSRKPVVFLEVKQVGKANGADRQLFEYAFHTGVPMAVLTDGQEWHFFLPAEQGTYEERRVYMLDLLSRNATESTEILSRYLGYENTVTGNAIKNAREDYRNVAKRREVREALPDAWSRILAEPDELLIEILSDRVESLCGHRPEYGDVSKFLKGFNAGPQLGTNLPGPRTKGPIQTPSRPNPTPSEPVTSSRRQTYVLFGQTRVARNATQMVVDVFDELAKRDDQFLEKFASLPRHGRKRRYLARDPKALYPDRMDLAEFAQPLTGGWVIGTNFANREKRRMLEIACEVANIRFGYDLQIDL